MNLLRRCIILKLAYLRNPFVCIRHVWPRCNSIEWRTELRADIEPEPLCAGCSTLSFQYLCDYLSVDLFSFALTVCTNGISSASTYISNLYSLFQWPIWFWIVYIINVVILLCWFFSISIYIGVNIFIKRLK